MCDPGLLVKVSIRDNDRGYRALIRVADDLSSGVEVTVGLHAEDADGSLVEEAERNEFGSPGGLIPARPSIGAWADERGQEAMGELADATGKLVVKGRDPLQHLDAMAQKFAGEIQQKIAGQIPPPNAASTIAKKGSSTPLIDTGQFRSSIRGKAKRA